MQNTNMMTLHREMFGLEHEFQSLIQWFFMNIHAISLQVTASEVII